MLNNDIRHLKLQNMNFVLLIPWAGYLVYPREVCREKIPETSQIPNFLKIWSISVPRCKKGWTPLP